MAMSPNATMRDQLAPEHLLAAYAAGIFPMADDEGELHWLAPDPRAVIELDRFQASRSLRATVRRGLFTITVNEQFDEVIAACANRREGTWISRDILRSYRKLHLTGFAHSVEAWKDGELAGGLYGVAIGAAFFGESMFHRITDASKVALAELVARLRHRRFTLLDVQFTTEHLRRFGAVEISRKEYLRRLRRAIVRPCTFDDRLGPTAVQPNPHRRGT